MAADAAGGGPSHPHPHECVLDIFCTDAAHIYHAQKVLEIGGYLIAGVEIGLESVVDFLAAIECGVGGHESHPHTAGPENLAAVVPHYVAGIGFRYVIHIGIHGVGIRIGIQSVGYYLQYLRLGIEIVAIQDAHHIASGCGYSLIHSVVDALVGG